MNNFRVDVTSEGKINFDKVMSLFNHTAIGYRIDAGITPILIFYWAETKSMIPFPVALSEEEFADMAHKWLSLVDYGPQPDHDGDNDKGWRIYNEAWGHVHDEWQAFVAVEPAWAMYGK